MSKHICYDTAFPEDWVACYCALGRDHSDNECDGEGHE